MIALALAALLQDEPTLRAEYSAGALKVSGQASLPDGAILELELQRIGWCAGLYSSRLESLPVGDPWSMRLQARNGSFATNAPVPICGDYRLRLSFKHLWQEQERALEPKEFEIDRRLRLGSASHVLPALCRSLTAVDGLTRRMEATIGELTSRPSRQVADALARLMSECRQEIARSLLTATLLAHVDACALYHKMIAIDSKIARRNAPGSARSDFAKNDSDSKNQPEPAQGVAPQSIADLAQLRRLAAREAAMVVLALAQALPETARPKEEAAALTAFLQENEPVRELVCETANRWSEACAERDPDKARALLNQLSSDARALAEKLASSVR